MPEGLMVSLTFSEKTKVTLQVGDEITLPNFHLCPNPLCGLDQHQGAEALSGTYDVLIQSQAVSPILYPEVHT